MEPATKLQAVEKTIVKQRKQIQNFENVLDALKDELREAREVARATEIVAERCRGEAERLAVENERYLAVIEALASALDARNR